MIGSREPAFESTVLAFMFGPLVGLFAVCTWQTHRKCVRVTARQTEGHSLQSPTVLTCMYADQAVMVTAGGSTYVNFITGLIVIHISSCNGHNFSLFLERAVLGFSIACQFVFEGQVVVSNFQKI